MQTGIWQLIDSAPTDGTPILLWDRHLTPSDGITTHGVVVGFAQLDGARLTWRCDVQVLDGYCGDSCLTPVELDPTHWAALPPLPKAAGKSQP